MSLTGKWQSVGGGNVDIYIMQNGEVVTMNWTEASAHWAYAAGIVAGSVVKMSFADPQSTQLTADVSADGNTINWSNGQVWNKV